MEHGTSKVDESFNKYKENNFKKNFIVLLKKKGKNLYKQNKQLNKGKHKFSYSLDSSYSNIEQDDGSTIHECLDKLDFNLHKSKSDHTNSTIDLIKIFAPVMCVFTIPVLNKFDCNTTKRIGRVKAINFGES